MYKQEMKFMDQLKTIVCEVLSADDWDCSVKRKSFVDYWRLHIRELVELYYRLEDEDSRDTYLKLIRYYLGILMSGEGAQEKYTIYKKKIWDELIVKAENLPHVKKRDYVLDRVECFVLEGYRYKDIVSADEGDVVLDCGAYTGNTALYFSNRVGSDGKVYAFEAMPSNFQILKENMEDIKCNNVISFNYAICDKKQELMFHEAGGSSRATDSGNIKVEGISIDEFVLEHNITKIDFLKMDIEGSEANGLDGAKKTINKFQPKLAICIYHKPSDFIDIPARILSICPSYQFYIGHSSTYHAETVLFGIVRDERKIIVDDQEVAAVDDIFNLYWKIYQSKEELLFEQRRHFLLECSVRLKELGIDWIVPVYEKEYKFVKYPVSKDGEIHYEIGEFKRKNIHVSLHFEGKWISQINVIDKEISKLDLPLYQTRIGWSYSVEGILEIEYIAKLIGYLVSCTLPVLKRNGLVSDDVLLGIRRDI